MQHNMREKEPWMQKGARVIKSGRPGIIKTFAESNVGGKTVVHTMHVQMEGVEKPFPFNPNDIDPANS